MNEKTDVHIFVWRAAMHDIQCARRVFSFILQGNEKNQQSILKYMYIGLGQGQTAPRGQNFDVNRKALSLYPFVASFKEISLTFDFIHFFS